MEVVLIRHTSVDVPKGTCYGWTDVPVRDSFEQEAEATRQSLQQYLPFDKVYSSPLTRARKLAAYCGYPDAETDDRLKEMNMGEWEMQLYDEIQDPHLQEWYDDYINQSTTGGESFMQQYRRVASFLDQLKTRGFGRVAVFAHAGVLISAGLHAGIYQWENAWSNLPDYGNHITIKL
mgnify:CR=1 FL=1